MVAAGATSEQDRRAWTSWELGAAGAMVDEVVARGRRARAAEPESWT
jgi:hypothetical protein